MESKLSNRLINSLNELSIEPTGKENIDQGERLISVLAGGWLLYKSLKNLGKHPIVGIQGVATAGFMLYRGATGICPVYEKIGKDTTDPEAINITETIIVNAPREKVYAFWRNLSNLPKFMKHLSSVTETSEKQSTWVAHTPGGIVPIKWNAEITREQEGTYIGWQSVQGSVIDNAGKVEFKDTLNGIGTELHIEIDYFPPAGSIGRGVATLFNGVFEKMILEDVRNFKSYAEAEDFRQIAGLTT